MPKATTLDDTSAETPYSREPGSSATTSPSNSPRRSKGKPWTADELQRVFHYAIKNGAPGSDKGWEGVVEGRNGNQIRMLWKRLVPFIDSMLEAKGKGLTPKME